MSFYILSSVVPKTILLIIIFAIILYGQTDFFGVGDTHQCSGLILGSVLRNHCWQCLDAGDRTRVRNMQGKHSTHCSISPDLERLFLLKPSVHNLTNQKY